MAIDPKRFVKTKPLHIGVCGGAGQTRSLVQMLQNIREMGAIPHLMIDHGKYGSNDHVLEDAKHDMAKIDAVIIMGNNADLDPSSYGQTQHPATVSETQESGGRDRRCYEEAVITAAKDTKMPVLAICGGMQRVNIMQGGTLHQHIPDLLNGSRHHEQPGNGKDAQLTGESPLVTNGHYAIDPASKIGHRLVEHRLRDVCAHHQAIDQLGGGLRVSISHAEDNYIGRDGTKRSLIEGIETDPHGPLADWPMIGFQFHPEFNRSPVGHAALGWLAEEATKYHANHPSPHARASLAPNAVMASSIVTR